MIALIDYGIGNIKAFTNAYKHLNIPCRAVSSVAGLSPASKLILPGVGSFDHAMRMLERSGLKQKIEELVQDREIPVLGICVGMQMLALKSEEGSLPGLGWLDATVARFSPFPNGKNRLRLPHMGWNNAEPIQQNPLMTGLETDARFYFLHSYYFSCNRQEDAIASTEYSGHPFTSVVNKENIYGVQFHPEKSHHYGLQLLKNFAAL